MELEDTITYEDIITDIACDETQEIYNYTHR